MGGNPPLPHHGQIWGFGGVKRGNKKQYTGTCKDQTLLCSVFSKEKNLGLCTFAPPLLRTADPSPTGDVSYLQSLDPSKFGGQVLPPPLCSGSSLSMQYAIWYLC